MIDLRCLYLDQSVTGCGWALFDRGRVESGVWRLGEHMGHRAAAFHGLRIRVTRIFKSDPRGLDCIGHETPVHLAKDKLDKLIGLYGLVATLEGWSHRNQVEVRSYTVHQHRKSFLGLKRGEVPSDTAKRMCIERCRQYGLDPIDDNEAEAIAIMDCDLLKRKLVPPWREAHPFLTTL